MNSLKTNDNILENYISSLCKNIDIIDKSVHAFLPETGRYERLLKEAKLLEKQNKNTLPLFGLTVGVKDIFYVDDLPTRAGSNLPLEAFHGRQADIVTKLKNAGALILGKTVSTEFAAGEPNETVNPINHNYSPGGSSSGSAAAVAAGLCGLGIGTQTIGSTLRPASYCGIVGFKPTYGRINTNGVVAYAPSLDTVGLLTKNISSIIPIVKIVVSNWKYNKVQNSLPILGIPIGTYLDQADSDILKVFEKTIEQLKKNGYTIKEIPMFENIIQINENLWKLATYEMAKVHKNWYSKYKQLYRPKTIALIEKGLQVNKKTYHEMLEKQKSLHEFIENKIKQSGIDLWISPAALSYAPKMENSFTGDPAMNIPWTFAGLPSLSVPIKNSGKLPLGLQIVGGYEKDEMVLYESLSIEKSIQ
jgi:Asp-tRNA(Asn)/Glu-tRNA(Gln) amidotransferase A subunit family amidase